MSEPQDQFPWPYLADGFDPGPSGPELAKKLRKSFFVLMCVVLAYLCVVVAVILFGKSGRRTSLVIFAELVNALRIGVLVLWMNRIDVGLRKFQRWAYVACRGLLACLACNIVLGAVSAIAVGILLITHWSNRGAWSAVDVLSTALALQVLYFFIAAIWVGSTWGSVRRYDVEGVYVEEVDGWTQRFESLGPTQAFAFNTYLLAGANMLFPLGLSIAMMKGSVSFASSIALFSVLIAALWLALARATWLGATWPVFALVGAYVAAGLLVYGGVTMIADAWYDRVAAVTSESPAGDATLHMIQQLPKLSKRLALCVGASMAVAGGVLLWKHLRCKRVLRTAVTD